MKEIKLYLIVGLVLLFLLIAVYFVVSGIDKEQGKKYELPADNQLNEVDKYKVNEIAHNLFNELNEWNFFHDEVPLRMLMELSDTSFVAVYNLWQEKYFNDAGGSLIETLKNEWFGWGAYETNKEAILNRYNRLGIDN